MTCSQKWWQIIYLNVYFPLRETYILSKYLPMHNVCKNVKTCVTDLKMNIQSTPEI